MLKYKCLVLDHDDTVVQSEATVNYPYFCQLLDQLRPGTTITLQEYTDGCYYQGFVQMCKTRFQFTDKEMDIEYLGWKEYMKSHPPKPFEGIRELLQLQRENGGLICVVSHSTKETILRDYQLQFQMMPDEVFGWDLPEHQRKPNTYPIMQIMEKYSLTPADLLVIDDMKTGWEMANKANVKIVFAAWGRQNNPDLISEMSGLCDLHFDQVKDLTNFLF